jgi:hypothetical protein
MKAAALGKTNGNNILIVTDTDGGTKKGQQKILFLLIANKSLNLAKPMLIVRD